MPPLGRRPPPLPLRQRPQLQRPAAARRVGKGPPAGSRRQPAAGTALQGKSWLERRLGQTFGQERRRPCAWKDTLSTLSMLSRTLRHPAGAAWTAAAPTRALCDAKTARAQRCCIDTCGSRCLYTNDAQVAPAPPSMNTTGAALFACHPQDYTFSYHFRNSTAAPRNRISAFPPANYLPLALLSAQCFSATF